MIDWPRNLFWIKTFNANSSFRINWKRLQTVTDSLQVCREIASWWHYVAIMSVHLCAFRGLNSWHHSRLSLWHPQGFGFIRATSLRRSTGLSNTHRVDKVTQTPSNITQSNTTLHQSLHVEFCREHNCGNLCFALYWKVFLTFVLPLYTMSSCEVLNVQGLKSFVKSLFMSECIHVKQIYFKSGSTCWFPLTTDP